LSRCTDRPFIQGIIQSLREHGVGLSTTLTVNGVTRTIELGTNETHAVGSPPLCGNLKRGVDRRAETWGTQMGRLEDPRTLEADEVLVF
jgi:hypothetical protein